MALLVEQSHNDALQLLVTGGALGFALGATAFASMFVLLMRAWQDQEHREESAIALAGLGALLALTLHGLVDFNMSVPAIPITLAAMLGVAWSASRHDQGVRMRETQPLAKPAAGELAADSVAGSH